MVEVVVKTGGGLRMVASHLLLMNHFLMSLGHNTADLGAFHDINSVTIDAGQCSYGCTLCSPVNGCLACKPPFFLSLHREGVRQTATCARTCPKGFYKLKKKRNGFCAKCTMRGCVECVDSRYCSTCDAAYLNFFGKCIKQKPDGGREDLGIYTTTRRPANYNASSGDIILPTKFKDTSFTTTAAKVNQSHSVTVTTPGSFQNASSEGPNTSSPTVPAPTSGDRNDQYDSSRTGHRVAPVDLGTRFYFTTPTSSILSQSSASGIYPYPSQTPTLHKVPCRRRGEKRPGKPRGTRRRNKGRNRGRKKKERDRKYRRRRRRRKGRRGAKKQRKFCQEWESVNKNENVVPTPSTQDLTLLRNLNSTELIHEESDKQITRDQSGAGIVNSTKNSPPLYHNRPRDMVAFKKILAMQRKNKGHINNPKFPSSLRHRIRHGNSRITPPKGQRTGAHSAVKRKTRNRRLRQMQRRERDRADQFPSLLSMHF